MRMLQVQSNNMSLGALASTLGESSHWPRALQQLKVQTNKEPNLSIDSNVFRVDSGNWARLSRQMVVWQMLSPGPPSWQAVRGTQPLVTDDRVPSAEPPRLGVPVGRPPLQCWKR